MFSGSIPALVTPFRDGLIDEAAFRALIDWQITEGSNALVPVGTTGEAPTLSNEEHHRIIRITVEQAAGRVPVIAGCGSNDTQTALSHLRVAEEAGATAALMVAPYYNRPDQDGMIAHFEYLGGQSKLPMVLYNVPGRTITDMSPETVARLAKLPTVIGIKDATGDIGRVTAHRLSCGEDFCLLTGNDDSALGFMAMGGAGCISVTANVAPRLCADFQAACARGDWAKAKTLQDRLYPLHMAMFVSPSPGPAKYALSRVRSDILGETRLPILPANEKACAAVDAALAHAGIALENAA